MSRTFPVFALMGLVGIPCWPFASVIAAPVGTAVTYQGRLKNGGSPLNATADFQFTLWDSPDTDCATPDGAQIGLLQTVSNVTVTDGLFTVELNGSGQFGANAFNGSARWLQIAVRSPAGSGVYTKLCPRQPLTATPYALFALASGGALTLPYNGSANAPVDAVIEVTNSAPSGLSYGLRGDANSPNGRGVIGVAQAASGAAIGVQGSAASPDGYGLYGGNDLGVGVYGGSYSGRAGLFEITSSTNGANALEIRTNGNSNSQAVYALHSGAGDCGLFEINNSSSAGEAVEGRTNGTGDAIQGIMTGTGRGGYFQINNSGSGNSAVYATTNGTGAGIKGVGHYGVYGEASEPAGYGGYFDGYGSFFGGNGLFVGGQTHLFGGVGIGTTTVPSGVVLNVEGTARTKVLEITGADVAEKFPTSDKPEPGMVMEIDPDNAGKLRTARGAYNRRVAGIVSGAGDFSAGAVLGHLPGSEDAPPVALSGRVYCWCDGAEGAIQPGDLLTTSATSGHAMKVSEYARAQGAILGKAMTALARGEKGLVLVLVTLQ